MRTAPGSTANDPGIRSDTTAFGEDTQRGYDQTAFFGSVDFDIIPDMLTVTPERAGTSTASSRSAPSTGRAPVASNVPNGDCAGGMVNIDSHHDHVTYTGFKSRANITWHDHAGHDGLLHCSRKASVRAASTARTARRCSRTRAGKNQF